MTDLSNCDTYWKIELFNTTSSLKSGVISSFFFKTLLPQHYFIFILEKSKVILETLLWGSTP